MLNILAADLSLTQTGLCLPDGSTTVFCTSAGTGLVGMAEQRHLVARQLMIRDAVLDYARRAGADLVAIEGYSYGSPQQATQVGGMGAIVRLGLEEEPDMRWVVVPPSSRALYATGKGNASKDMVLQEVAARRGATFKTTDECDAWVIWELAKAAYGLPTEVQMPQKHLEALTGVDWPTVPVGTGPFAGFPAQPISTYKPKTKKKRS